MVKIYIDRAQQLPEQDLIHPECEKAYRKQRHLSEAGEIHINSKVELTCAVPIAALRLCLYLLDLLTCKSSCEA